jgi:hypothetical protein
MALGVCARDVAGVCGDQKLGCGVKWDALHCRIVGESEFGGLGTHVDCSITHVTHRQPHHWPVLSLPSISAAEAYSFLDGYFDIVNSIMASRDNLNDYYPTRLLTKSTNQTA